ncbi:DUF6894 family protein [Microvirga sp. 2TAF3]|uniref:DUF6894 family protein n=1 Tax=Microvirga sp. 2TAF3 TaxID=3233014 RepID=UPI003F97277B
MPRYYFNLRRAHLHLLDKSGEECSNLGEAIEYAIVAVLNLISEEGRFRNWTSWAVEIQDEARYHVATLPFTMVLEADLRRKE